MSMTHYMELLATNQPWNLLLYMAIPVVLAETIAIAELYLLYTRNFSTWVHQVSRWAGIIAGAYFTVVFVNLMGSAVLPLTQTGGWRGPADVIAVLSYLAGVVPLGGIALLELGLIEKHSSPEAKLRLHAIFVGIFLVVAHVAMIFGMLNPEIFGWDGGSSHQMPM